MGEGTLLGGPWGMGHIRGAMGKGNREVMGRGGTMGEEEGPWGGGGTMGRGVRVQGNVGGVTCLLSLLFNIH